MDESSHFSTVQIMTSDVSILIVDPGIVVKLLILCRFPSYAPAEVVHFWGRVSTRL